MNFIDIAIIVPVIYAAWNGYRKGIVLEVFTLLALLLGIYAGIRFSDLTSEFIRNQLQITGKYLPVVAFTLTFLIVGAAVFFGGKMIERTLKAVNLSMVNKLLGLFLGTIKMSYIISVLLVLLETYDERSNFVPEEMKVESALYHPVKQISIKTFPVIEESKIWLKNNDLNIDLLEAHQ